MHAPKIFFFTPRLGLMSLGARIKLVEKHQQNIALEKRP